MNLSHDQAQAVEAIVEWMLTPNSNYFLLQGAAGTGKTTVLKTAYEEIKKVHETHVLLRIPSLIITGTSLNLTATTNEAALNMQAICGFTQPSSIHKLLQIHPIKKGKNQKAELTKTNVKLHNQFVVIDEASMVDEALFTEIQRAVTSTTKILFVGDALQLPPVDEIMSKVFTSGFPSATLTTNYRQTKPTLATVVNHLRTFVEDSSTVATLITNEDVQILSAEEFRQLYKTNLDSCILLSFTNNVVNKANRFKEEAIYGEFTWRIGEKVVISGDTAYFLRVSTRYLTVSFYDPVDNTIRFDETNNQLFHVGYSKEMQWIDISKQHAMTIHRSQGRQFKHVFLNISGYIPEDIRNKLLYVAASRATEKLYVYTGK